MILHLWIAMSNDGPSLVVACRERRHLAAAIRRRVEADLGHPLTPGMTTPMIEAYLLNGVYDRVMQTVVTVDDTEEIDVRDQREDTNGYRERRPHQ